MTQLEQVKKWLGNPKDSNGWTFNVAGSKFYGYTFYKRNGWDGEFSSQNDLDNYKHVINLETGEQLR